MSRWSSGFSRAFIRNRRLKTELQRFVSTRAYYRLSSMTLVHQAFQPVLRHPPAPPQEPFV
jgi:hypothetical protein